MSGHAKEFPAEMPTAGAAARLPQPGEDRTAGALLMLANCFPPQNISGAKRPHRFAKYLPEFGYRTEIVSASGALPGWEHVHSTPHGQERRGVVLASRFLEFTQRHFLPYTDSLPWIPYAVAAGGEAIAHSGAAAVFSTSPPVASHLAALEIKRRYGLKWIADFRDPLLGNPFRTRKGAWIYDGAIEWLIFRFADAIVANTDAVAECWRKRYPRWAHKIHLIWNGYDPEEELRPVAIPPRRARVLAHVGSIYGGRVPTPLLLGIGRLIDRGRLSPAELRIQLVGKLEPADLLERDPAFASLAARIDIQYTGRTIPEAEAKRAMAEADYLCLLDTNQKNAGLQVPAKLFDYIRVGRPILALTAKDSPARRVLARGGVPYTCIFPDSSEVEIDDALAAFLRLPGDAGAPSPWFWETFDGRNQTRQLAAILDRLLSAAERERKICAA